MTADQVLETIWNNWRDRTGPCESCPHWGSGGGNKPFFGIGDLSAEVALVALEPGPSGDVKNPDLENDTDGIESYIKEEYPEQFMDTRTPLHETGMYREHSPQMRNCIDALEDRGHSLYFTNAKKCRVKEDGNRDEAIDCCSQYLTDELAGIEPQVIVVFGKPALKVIYDSYDVLEHHPEATKKITEEALTPRSLEAVTIIPSVHFSNQFVRANIPEKMGVEEYWGNLADRVTESISA